MANLFANSRTVIVCAALSVPVVFVAFALLIRGMPTHREYADLSDEQLRWLARIGLGLLVVLGVGWCGMIAAWLG
jgi:hypothetical protein